jgi:hypothetical protein
MARIPPTGNCRLEAVGEKETGDVPEAARLAFDEAAQRLQRPGAFESHAIVVDTRAFSDLTGFAPVAGELIPISAVLRAAEVATVARTQALANCGGAAGADYVALGGFLRVCAAHRLALRAVPHVNRRWRK